MLKRVESYKESPVNFNTVLLILVGSLVTLGVSKADKALTKITELAVEHRELERRVGVIELDLGTFSLPIKKP